MCSSDLIRPHIAQHAVDHAKLQRLADLAGGKIWHFLIDPEILTIDLLSKVMRFELLQRLALNVERNSETIDNIDRKSVV